MYYHSIFNTWRFIFFLAIGISHALGAIADCSLALEGVPTDQHIRACIICVQSLASNHQCAYYPNKGACLVTTSKNAVPILQSLSSVRSCEFYLSAPGPDPVEGGGSVAFDEFEKLVAYTRTNGIKTSLSKIYDVLLLSFATPPETYYNSLHLKILMETRFAIDSHCLKSHARQGCDLIDLLSFKADPGDDPYHDKKKKKSSQQFVIAS